MNLKRLTVILTGAAIAAAMTSVPALAANEVEVETDTVKSTDTDVVIKYYGSTKAVDFVNGTLTVGTDKTADGTAIIDKLLDNDKDETVGYGGSAGSGAYEFFVVDLSAAQNKQITSVTLHGANDVCAFGLTNTFLGTENEIVQLDYAAKAKWDQKYNTDYSDITLFKSKAATFNNSYYDYTFVGNDISKYKYIIIHNNTNDAQARWNQLTELTITYRKSDIPSNVAATAPLVDCSLGYYSDFISALDGVQGASFSANIQNNRGISVYGDVSMSTKNLYQNTTVKSGINKNVALTAGNTAFRAVTSGNRTYNFYGIDINSKGYPSIQTEQANTTVNYSNGTIDGRIFMQKGGTVLNLYNATVKDTITASGAYASDQTGSVLTLTDSKAEAFIAFNSDCDTINLNNSTATAVDVKAESAGYTSQTTEVEVLDTVTGEGSNALELNDIANIDAEDINDNNLATAVVAEFNIPNQSRYYNGSSQPYIKDVKFTSPTVTWEIEYAEDVGKTKKSITSSAEAETLTYNKGVEVDKTNNKIGMVFTGVALNKENFKATVTLTGGGSATFN